MRWFLIGLIFLKAFTGTCQLFPEPAYPKGYFRNPLNILMNLSGNFGELRPNHFHMGLDLRTNKKVNLPVYAAADGYIAKVKIEPGGFGRAIYINHPNGFTTVYAHLNDFNQRLEQYIKRQQYEQESWSIFIDIPPELFPVKIGEFLAYSGSTGGSQAPHLHFEIRRTGDDINLNPLLFGFFLPDNIPPKIYRLAIYDRNKSTYESTPRLIGVKRISSTRYSTVLPLIPVSSNKISFAISSRDNNNRPGSPNGIFESVLFVDGKAIIGFRMDNISYNDTRNLNAHIDYKTKATGGMYLQHLAELPGYVNSIYGKFQGDGVIDIGDGEVHDVKIIVKDTKGNTSQLQTRVQYKENNTGTQPSEGKRFYPLINDGYETDESEFYIGERCLYDSVNIRYVKSSSSDEQVVSNIHSIGSTYVPLHERFLVRIRPTRQLDSVEEQHTVMQLVAGEKKEVQKVEWLDGWATTAFRDFGSFKLVLDEEPPVIIPLGFSDGSNLSKATRIVFTIKDNLNEYKNVRAELDGKWLRFTNDKGRSFIYRFDEHCLGGPHELKISAEDVAGNRAVETYRFSR